jgi:hypothetical protein
MKGTAAALTDHVHADLRGALVYKSMGTGRPHGALGCPEDNLRHFTTHS